MFTDEVWVLQLYSLQSVDLGGSEKKKYIKLAGET